jgi:hypothetical protein
MMWLSYLYCSAYLLFGATFRSYFAQSPERNIRVGKAENL